MAVSLVCLHGLAGSSRWWGLVEQDLRRSGPVELIDLPRRVPPSALPAWVAETLSTLGGPVDLAGHSLGALVAVRVAASRPELVRRLVLIAPPGLQPRSSPLHLGVPLLTSLARSRPGILRRLVVDAARRGPANVVRGALHAARADVSDELAAVRAPTLLIWGERDRLVPATAGAVWLAAIPASRLVVLAKAGHVPMIETPAELAAAVAAFRQEPLDDHSDKRGV